MKLRGVSAAISHVGKVRQINEDACLDLAERGLWVVADGMGGHAAGDFASNSIVQALAQVNCYESLSGFIEDVEQRLLTVDRLLRQMAEERSASQKIIGSTVAVLLAYGYQVACLWAGDSRIYRWRDGDCRCLTRDHSEVNDLVARGMLTSEEAERHPYANVISRAIGALAAEQSVELRIFDLRVRDRFLLCSDGLYRNLSALEISSELANARLTEVCGNLFQHAMTRECSDNLTGIAVEFLDA